MPQKTTTVTPAKEIAELTFDLLANCQEKEERLAEQLKISVPEFRLVRIFRGEKKIPIKTLVERINLSGSRLTRILDSLEKNGYLARSIDPTDRRVITVTLSKKGIDLSGKLEENYIKFHEGILKDIPKELHAPMMQGMQNMLTSLQVWLRGKK
jgi:DNA-binding MarR family transcriptional regulator